MDHSCVECCFHAVVLLGTSSFDLFTAFCWRILRNVHVWDSDGWGGCGGCHASGVDKQRLKMSQINLELFVFWLGEVGFTFVVAVVGGTGVFDLVNEKLSPSLCAFGVDLGIVGNQALNISNLNLISVAPVGNGGDDSLVSSSN